MGLAKRSFLLVGNFGSSISSRGFQLFYLTLMERKLEFQTITFYSRFPFQEKQQHQQQQIEMKKLEFLLQLFS